MSTEQPRTAAEVRPPDLVVVVAGDDHHAAVVTASGEVDLFTAPRLHAALVEAASGGAPALLVDLSAVTFIDSAGLGVLVAAFKRSRAHGGALHLVVPPGRVRRPLEVLGLDAVLPLHSSLDGAVGAVGAPLVPPA